MHIERVDFMKNSFVETAVGAVVILIAAVFFTYAYKTSGSTTGLAGYNVVAKFDHIDGISTGSDVRMSGIKIGTVSKHKLDAKTFQAIVTLAITTPVKLPEDTNAKITSEGLLGGNYISLEPGGSEKFIKEGGEIEFTTSSVDLISLIGRAVFGSSKSK